MREAGAGFGILKGSGGRGGEGWTQERKQPVPQSCPYLEDHGT